jgi:hypothetical protein
MTMVTPGDWSEEPAAGPAPATPRPYIGVLFECCGVYTRIYRKPDHDAYVGRCPKCFALVRARVGPDGVSTRIFRAS